MAVPKYFLPAALAILKRPVLEVLVSVRSENDDAGASSMDPSFTLLGSVDVEEL